MYYAYSIFTDTDKPVMLLDGELGKEVSGALFARELLSLSESASVISIWINSIGGTVLDAYEIIGAINKCKVPVDTYNIGMAASSAFNIFVHGRKRYMMDYAQVMTHEVMFGGENAERWNESVGKILSQGSGKSVEELRSMMAQETWMNADECLSLGFCDEIEQSGVRVEAAENKMSELLKVGNTYIQEKGKQLNIKYMKSVANKLGLNEAANEEQVLAAINKLEQAKAAAESNAANAVSELTEVKNTLEATKSELVAANAKIAQVENDAIEAKVSNLISEAQNAGKLPKADTDENKAVLNHWTSLAKEKFDLAKNLIEALPVNKVAPNLPINVDPGVLVVNMANEMAKINEKTKSN